VQAGGRPAVLAARPTAPPDQRPPLPGSELGRDRRLRRPAQPRRNGEHRTRTRTSSSTAPRSTTRRCSRSRGRRARRAARVRPRVRPRNPGKARLPGPFESRMGLTAPHRREEMAQRCGVRAATCDGFARGVHTPVHTSDLASALGSERAALAARRSAHFRSYVPAPSL